MYLYCCLKAHAVQEGSNPQVQKRLDSLEKENKTLKKSKELLFCYILF